MKRKEARNIFIFLLLGIFLISLVGASTLGTIKQEDCIDLYQSCSDCTYVNLTTIKYPNATIDMINVAMTKSNTDYNYTFCLTNTTGEYFYTTKGDKGGVVSLEVISFEVTPTGFVPNIARGIIGIGLLLLLVLFFLFSLIGLFKIEDYKSKFALYWACHILIVGITFIAWNMAIENLMNENAIAGIFKVLFYLSIFAVLPMVILSGAWIFYIHTFNEHFQKILDKGEDPETAFAMSKKKSKGWFNGRSK